MRRILICQRGRLPASRLNLNRSHRQFCPKRRRLPALSSEQQFLASPSRRFPSSCWSAPSRPTPAGSPGLRLVPTGNDWPRGARTRPSSCGMCPPGKRPVPSPPRSKKFRPWPSVATDIGWRRRIPSTLSRFGMPRRGGKSARSPAISLWDVETGRSVRDLGAARRSVIYIAFSPDGRWLASGGDDKTIKIWEVATGKEIQTLRGHKKNVYAVVFSSNGRYLASASADKSVKLWDVTTGREIHTLTGHGSDVSSIAFSPDSRWLASGSWDKTIKIWDVQTGREVRTLEGHTHHVYTVAFDSRGSWLASGSEDGTIKLWRLHQR